MSVHSTRNKSLLWQLLSNHEMRERRVTFEVRRKTATAIAGG